MSLTAQTKVLRAIQEQKIERIGGEQTIDVDVRIVAATNKNLNEACKDGPFRQDLFFRLNVIPIHIPPLRVRASDIQLILFRFLKDLGVKTDWFQLSDAAAHLLQSYPWPGNVRELRNLAERIHIMHSGGMIEAHALADLLQHGPANSGSPSKSAPETGLAGILDLNYNEAKKAFEKYYLTHQLAKNDGVINRAAKSIGIKPPNLHTKLKQYKIRTEK
jgi:two-component system nitrogen regulation response regulator NtrX